MKRKIDKGKIDMQVMAVTYMPLILALITPDPGQSYEAKKYLSELLVRAILLV